MLFRSEHNGLTDFGAEVVRRCNKLGIVVDVAHGTLDLVRRAVRTTTKPLVLSHTSLLDRFRQFTRRISVEHAKAIADTNGVIGIWPVGEYFPTIADYARHMADMARLIGADHVGVGTDLRGLTGASAIADYHELPQLAGGLRAEIGRAHV